MKNRYEQKKASYEHKKNPYTQTLGLPTSIKVESEETVL